MLFRSPGADSDTLLRRADVALYIAKHTRNAYAVYDAAHDQNSVDQLSLRAELRSAIDQGESVYITSRNYILKQDILLVWKRWCDGLTRNGDCYRLINSCRWQSVAG